MQGQGIEYTEVVVANDGLSVVVNPENTWAKRLTVAQLKTMWRPNRRARSRTGIRSISPSRMCRWPSSALALIQARSTTSPRRSTVKRARAAPTTAHPRTTT